MDTLDNLLPNIEEAGIIAIKISDKLNMTATEQSYFVAGFQECIKFIKKNKE